jgi:hypothetical protein
MRVTLERGSFGWDFIMRADNGETVLCQVDWDYPGVASNLGFVPCEHCTADAMIDSAKQFLSDHIGESFEDPGYFGND